jgi:HPt (histidine-containing phosphotransfer) domain-containing protein
MAPSDLLDATTLRNLVELDDGGYGLLTEMLDIFREDTPRRLQDILKALAEQDAEALSRAAHALKGGAGALGAKALRIAAADLEALGRSGSTLAGGEVAGQLEGMFQASLTALETYIQERGAD